MVLIAVVAVLMLMIGIGMFNKGLPGDTTSQPAAPERLRPTEPAVDLTAPFAGTPAEQWGAGADGIVTPPPMQVGEFSAETVAAATATVREALIASRIDPKLLIDHDPNGYLGLLAPDARRQLQPLFGDGREPQAQSLVSLIAKAATLLPAPPKVTGSMRVATGGPGELLVQTNFVFAYAFDAPDPSTLTDAMDVVVVVRAEVEYVLRSGPRWTPGSQGLWYGNVGGFGYSIACDWYKRGFLAPAHLDPNHPQGSSGTVLPRQDRSAYFDPTAPLPAESGCSTS